jgi:competence protein ComEA
LNTKNITPDEIKILLLAAGVFIAGIAVLHQRSVNRVEPFVISHESGSEDAAGGESVVVVDVGGAVWRPGVYFLPEGARVGEVLDEAMLRPDADIDRVNRAGVLYDGQKLIVPSVSSGRGDAVPAGENPYININSATVQQLQELPLIGEARARDIVDYRKRNGPFKSVDELSNISGIGPSTVERLRERVVVR